MGYKTGSRLSRMGQAAGAGSRERRAGSGEQRGTLKAERWDPRSGELGYDGGDLFSNHESRIENPVSPEWDPCSGELGYEWEYQWPMMNDQGGGSSGDFALPRIGIGTINVQQSRMGQAAGAGSRERGAGSVER